MQTIEEAYTRKPEGYFGELRSMIFPLLPKKAVRILDVGAGGGVTLAEVKQRVCAQEAVAIELFPNSAALAEKLVDKVIQGDVETLDFNILGSEPFDLILCLDVLEHLRDPWTVVKRLVGQLSPGGQIIASIPNINHFSATFPLLFRGKWNYEEMGILDNTHLRFFVRETAIKLMSVPGVEIIDVRSSNLGKGSKAGLLNHLTMGLFERFLSIQYLIVARKL